jgi:hypothetical protein
MGYSGISIQSNGGSVFTAASDVQVLRNAGVKTIAVQIKPDDRNKKLQLNNWQQALQDELGWALAIVEACNDSEYRKINVVIRFNDLVSNDDPSLFQVDTEAWWNDQASISTALNYWQQVCLNFNGQDIFLFEILSEPVIKDNGHNAISPDRRKLEDFYQAALDIVRMYNSDAYFILSPGPYGKYDKYLNGFVPFNIIDSARPQKLMYGFHMYELHIYTHQGVHNSNRPQFYPTYNNSFNTINTAFAGISAWSLQYGYPIYMGEFNTVRWSPNAIDWVKNVIENAVFFDFHWSFFAFNPYFDGWNPYFDVDNPDAINPSYWTIAYVGPNASLWQFLLTQF